MSELTYPHTAHPEPGETVELSPGVFWLTMPMGGSLNHINLYLLEDEAGWYIIDTGLNNDETRQWWQHQFDRTLGGKPVAGVICTHMHPDHVGLAGWITDQHRCPLYMTHGEYYQARAFSNQRGTHHTSWHGQQFYTRAGMPEDYMAQLKEMFDARGNMGFGMPEMPSGFRRLRDGDVMSIGGVDWRIVVGAGHSPEHACLYSSARKILISGDQVLPIITSNVSVHPNEPEANPLKQWMDSLDRFLEIPADTFVLPAHNLPFHGVRERLRELMSHHEDRMLAIEEHCVTPALATELLPVLFSRKLDPRTTMMALGEAIAHLHLLMHRNRIDRTLAEDGRYRFRSIAPDLERRAHPQDHDAPDDSPMWV